MPFYPVVDGGWGEWGPWSIDCPVNCMQERKKKRSRIRTRACSNPAPQGDGIACVGEKIEMEMCGKNISEFNVVLPVGCSVVAEIAN